MVWTSIGYAQDINFSWNNLHYTEGLLNPVFSFALRSLGGLVLRNSNLNYTASQTYKIENTQSLIETCNLLDNTLI